MPSSIVYLNVVFRQDKLIGNTVYPTGWETSLPEDLARSLEPQFVTITGVGTYQEMVAPDGSTAENGAFVTVLATDSAATIRSKILTLNDETVEGSPEGVGRIVQLPAARLTTDGLSISQAQTVKGVKGSTILTLSSTATLLDLGSGVGAYIRILDDFLSSGGIAGQGVIEDLDIDATASQAMVSPATIHGLYAPDRAGDAVAHTYRNVTVYGAKNDGIHLAGGNDKLVCYRMRQEGSLGRGIYISGSDCKAKDIGSVAKGSAMEIDSAAVEMDTFDLWRRSDCNTDPTLKITGASNGCVIKSGTVEGQTLFIGKNENATNRYLNSNAKFAFVHFKYDSVQTPTSYFEARSADMVELVNCKFGESGNGTITPYNYLIEITNTGGTDRNGMVKIVGGAGLMRFVGRAGATNKMRIDALKHICNLPQRLLFEWGRMGQVDWVPAWAVDSSDPTMRTHLKCDGATYAKADYPFGYLAWAAHYGNWAALLDDATVNFTMPTYTAVSADCVPAIRVLP